MEGFFSYRKYLFMWVNLVGLLLLLAVYFFLVPPGGHRGGTTFGYFLGILSTFSILILMMYGIRKRSYHSHRTTLKGWLSVHVWLGLSLLLLVPLHSGFQAGLNLHGFTYYLMVVVILSGFWGALNYQRLPSQISAHRGGNTLKALIEQFHRLGATIEAASVGKSVVFLMLRDFLEIELSPSLRLLLFKPLPRRPSDTNLSALLEKIPSGEREESLNLIKLCEKKRELARQIQREVRISAKLKLWLLVHLPVSVALLIFVFVHIGIVLLYRV